MPVLVAPATSALAVAVAARLRSAGGEVRAFAVGDAEAELRAAGAFVARGEVDDGGALEAALTGVHTLVHVGVAPLAPSEPVGADVLAAHVRAAVAAGVRRVVATSLVGAAVGADPLRRSAGAFEDLLAPAPLPTVVVRAGLVDHGATRACVAASSEAATVPVAPVRLDDLAALLVALDDLRGTAEVGHVVFRAEGPRRTTVGAYREWILSAGRVGLPWGGADDHALAAALPGPWVDDAAPDAWSFTGVDPAPLPPPARDRPS